MSQSSAQEVGTLVIRSERLPQVFGKLQRPLSGFRIGLKHVNRVAIWLCFKFRCFSLPLSYPGDLLFHHFFHNPGLLRAQLQSLPPGRKNRQVMKIDRIIEKEIHDLGGDLKRHPVLRLMNSDI